MSASPRGTGIRRGRAHRTVSTRSGEPRARPTSSAKSFHGTRRDVVFRLASRRDGAPDRARVETRPSSFAPSRSRSGDPSPGEKRGAVRALGGGARARRRRGVAANPARTCFTNLPAQTSTPRMTSTRSPRATTARSGSAAHPPPPVPSPPRGREEEDGRALAQANRVRERPRSRGEGHAERHASGGGGEEVRALGRPTPARRRRAPGDPDSRPRRRRLAGGANPPCPLAPRRRPKPRKASRV